MTEPATVHESNKKRTVGIVSPYFPPSSRAGVHRARHLATHLQDHGWRPVVFHVDPAQYEEEPDTDLRRRLPDSLETISVDAVSRSLTRWVGIGDLGLRAYFALRRALREFIQREQPQVIMITGSPFYPLLLSRYVKQHWPEVRVVLDLQDPWVSIFNESQAWWTKRGLSHQLGKLLEPRSLLCADGLTTVSPTQNEELLARYPFLSDIPMAAFPIGGDPEDYEALVQYPPAHRSVTLSNNKFQLNYVGTYLPRAEPLMRILFKALHALLQDLPELRTRISLNFIGTSNRPEAVDDMPVLALADEEAVGDVVFEHPGRVPFLEALHLLKSADGILMIGSDERHYTASKIYPGLMSGKPYLAIFHSDSTSHQLLDKAGGGLVFGFSSKKELSALLPDLVKGLETLLRRPHELGAADESVYSEVTADAIAGGYAAFFNGLCEKA